MALLSAIMEEPLYETKCGLFWAHEAHRDGPAGPRGVRAIFRNESKKWSTNVDVGAAVDDVHAIGPARFDLLAPFTVDLDHGVGVVSVVPAVLALEVRWNLVRRDRDA